MRCTFIAILIALFLGGCSTLDMKNFQSDLFSWDDQNAQRNRDFMAQVKKHWDMNSSALKEYIGPKLQGEDFYSLRYSIEELDKLLLKADGTLRDEMLTDPQVGRGVVLFGKFLVSGGKAAADEIIPELVALFKKIMAK